jgi:hypothetical protein
MEDQLPPTAHALLPALWQGWSSVLMWVVHPAMTRGLRDNAVNAAPGSDRGVPSVPSLGQGV